MSPEVLQKTASDFRCVHKSRIYAGFGAFWALRCTPRAGRASGYCGSRDSSESAAPPGLDHPLEAFLSASRGMCNPVDFLATMAARWQLKLSRPWDGLPPSVSDHDYYWAPLMSGNSHAPSFSASTPADVSSTLTGESAGARRATIRWLIASALMVIVTLVVGGVTRLTESGLSITQWQPITGVIPPLSQAHWESAFQQYLLIPEAQTVHLGITLEQFKVLYWWEWAHRFAARLAGLVIALPFFVLLVRRQIPRRLIPQLLLLPVLTAAQGALGWYMVSSGLSDRTDVSQYRLVAHLGLALVIYVIAVWTAMTLHARETTRGEGSRKSRATALAVLTFVTILSGGFVAGLDAGHIYNTFPMMGSSVAPAGYWQIEPAWRNWFENPAAVQFNHRLLAMVVLVMSAWWWAASRRRVGDAREARAWNMIGLAVVVQVALGITTLVMRVPIPVAALHQLGAVALLTAALWAAAVGRR